MQRYLLFDSGCGRCTRIAEEVQRQTNGWLTGRSLRETEIQELLSRARPGWRWQPMLLLIDEEPVVLSGVRLGLYLVAKLGVAKALQLATVVYHSASSSSVENDNWRPHPLKLDRQRVKMPDGLITGVHLARRISLIRSLKTAKYVLEDSSGSSMAPTNFNRRIFLQKSVFGGLAALVALIKPRLTVGQQTHQIGLQRAVSSEAMQEETGADWLSGSISSRL